MVDPLDAWCVEFKDFKSMLVGPVVMAGQDWYANGRHRLRARVSVAEGSPFRVLDVAAKQVGVRTEWNKNAGWLNLTGDGWRAMASTGGSPELAMGTYLELHAEAQVEPSRAQAGARDLARRFGPFVPFVELAGREGAALLAVTRLEFAEQHIFGYLELYKEGLRSFLSSQLEGWLLEVGFTRHGASEEDQWTLAGYPPLIVSVGDPDPDKLRVDVSGLVDFELRPATRSTPPGPLEKERPPDHAAVVARAFCLAALCDRLLAETGWASQTSPSRQQRVERNAQVIAWLQSEELFAALSPVERQLLLQPVSGWTKVHHRDVSWRIESLGILGWALGLVDSVPGYATQFEIATLQSLFPLFDSTKPRERHGRLRPPEVLLREAVVARAWHQRADAVESRSGLMKSRRSVIKNAARKLFGDRPALFDARPGQPQPPEYELSPYGKPYSELTVEACSMARSISLQRRHALNWLCGGGAWDL
jgi:hypothetical protein